ncbi:hypothetical protein AX16_000202 [Volvariella volvacea WC 439]|nr:hypothetical protein AX16_000202 [Volvariella volvacea WC 439]
MNLARHSITSTAPVHVFDARFDPDCQIFTATTEAGFGVYRTHPLELIRKRELPGGTLAAAVPLNTSNILFLLGGGRSPLYPPNKVIVWDDSAGHEVAELEFRTRVTGLACRRGWLAVALKRRVVVFKIDGQITRHQEWETCDNPRGLLALSTAPHSTLLAIMGRQTGHVRLIHLPPCPPPPPRGPPSPTKAHYPLPPSRSHISFIPAHSSALTTITATQSGRMIATSSENGTLIRIWDTETGNQIRELRRGTDKAVIYGVAFRPDEKEVCVWSDKGTVHIFSLVVSENRNRQSSLLPLTPYLPLPKYFGSEWSYAQYRVPVQSAHISISSASAKTRVDDAPEEERCVVGWIEAPRDDASTSNRPVTYQLIALTYSGGWYRLSIPTTFGSKEPEAVVTIPSSPQLPKSPPKFSFAQQQHRPRTPSGSSTISRLDKGKERERDDKKKESRQCKLEEYRKYGRWDGWA